MKRVIVAFLLAVCVSFPSFAQRFKVGLRAGANLPDYAMSAVSLDDGVLHRGKTKAGFDASLMARLAVTRHLNIQAEFEFLRVGYDFDVETSGTRRQTVGIRSNRIEVPLLLGIDAGPLRFFGGVAFRLGHNEKSSVPSLLKIRFNDSDLALTGGAGVNIRRFFIEARITGNPRKARWTAVSSGKTYDLTARHNVLWGLSAGVMF